jgi:iron complex transport system ATP-binding protein
MASCTCILATGDLARALYGPGLLLLDEPIAAQDLAYQLGLLEVVRGHAQSGGSVVVVLHDLNWAAGIADRMLVLRQGRIYADGPPPAVLTSAMLAAVFDIDLEPGAVPPPSEPFIRPQLARPRRAS